MRSTAHRVHEACVDYLSEYGYSTLTLDALAERARTPLPPLVQRWGDRRAVVVESVGRLMKAGPADPDTGAFKTDIIQQATTFVRSIAGHSAELLGAMIEVDRLDPLVCERLATYGGSHGLSLPSASLERARARQEIAPDSTNSAYEDIVPRVIVARRMSHQDVDAQFIEELVDSVVLPAYGYGG
ncbi:hypothetical protein Val02_74760 [Virgisporangium aliadipatigenens]|uniref:Tetracyclin repressor-like C-terminal domain-containing protein n=1 Tax=Virgisporangium aliadipatigenens TaxID=741659 RepID=A0A8J4DTU3_9ACTN|nr:TetR-like C-terminal domain-containing protein [Virgisporangium aliadipatigenens]GIJ50590.1 hypothetical protein Val02_74760 [Virgisporangium aliadipatigenens]